MLFLEWIHNETMDSLNLIGRGHIYKMSFEDICDICRNYLQSHCSICGNSSFPLWVMHQVSPSEKLVIYLKILKLTY